MSDDLTAERAVLGAVLLTGGRALDDVALTAGEFSDGRHGALWTLLGRMAADSDAVDPVTVLARLREEPIPGVDAGYLHALVAHVPHAGSAGWYARQVREAADLRAVRAAGTRLAQAASTSDAETAREYARQVLDGLDSRDTGSDAPLLGEVLQPVLDAIEAGGEPGLSTPWPDLDRLIGGLRPGGLYVLGARPGLGKTALGLNMAWHVAQRHGQQALVHCLEMPRAEIVARLISAVADVDYEALANRRMDDVHWQRVTRAYGLLSTVPLRIDDRASVGLADIRARVRETSRRAPLGVVVVDYLQLLTPGDRRVPREQQVAELSRGLKLLAKDSGVPVVLLAQLNRRVEERSDKHPNLADLRESGAIEQDADVVMLLFRDEDDAPDVLEVGVPKNRQGRTGAVRLRWQGSRQRAVSAAMEGREW